MFFGNNKDKAIHKSILIISQNQERLSLISDYLSVRGLEVKTHNKPIKDFSYKDYLHELEAIIIELGEINDPQEDIELICKIFPSGIHRIILADNDSIAIKQSFLDRGIRYLHFHTQFDQLYTQIKSPAPQPQQYNSIRISILGTKGGIGNSFISYHLAKIIYGRYMTRTLLIQGAYSSFNLDLLSNQEFQDQLFKENDISLLKEKIQDIAIEEKLAQYSFNFILHDHSTHCMDKDKIEQILNTSDCALILISYDLSSIRKAKEILSINDFLLSVNQGSKKLIIAINELSTYKPLNQGDIEEILGKKVECLIPLNSHKEELKSKTKGKTQKELEKLASAIIGSPTKETRSFKKLFRGFV